MVNFRKLSTSDRDEAMKAFQTEMQKYVQYDNYERIPLREILKNGTILRSHVVFMLKLTKDDERKSKARCVIDGSKDIRHLYSSTQNAEQSEIRTIIRMASINPLYNGDIKTADVENGYFHAKTDEIICIIPPKLHADHGSYAWKLKKNVYGIPNAGRLFETFIEESLLSLGWQSIVGLKHS